MPSIPYIPYIPYIPSDPSTPTEDPTDVPTVTVTPTETTTPTETVAPTETATPTEIATPTPTASPTRPEPAYYNIDERFEAGYPKVEVTKDSYNHVNVTVKVKLAEGTASEEVPANVYVVCSSYDLHNYVTDSESVMHGHTAFTLFPEDESSEQIYHHTEDSGYSWAFKVTDNKEQEVTFSLYNFNKGLTVFSVVQTEAGTSQLPMRIELTEETAPALAETTAPKVLYAMRSAPRFTGDKQQRTIRMYFRDQISSQSDDLASLFTVSGTSVNAEIKSWDVHSATAEIAYSSNWVDLIIEVPADYDFSDFMLFYHKPEAGGLADMATVPNKVDDFVLYCNPNLRIPALNYYSIADSHTDGYEYAIISEDGKYAMISLTKINYADNKDLKYIVTINDEVWNVMGRDVSDSAFLLYVQNENAELANSYKVSITAQRYSKDTLSMEQVNTATNLAGDETNLPYVITNTVVDDESIPQYGNARYDKSRKSIFFESTGPAFFPCGCLFTLTIDGVSYRLRNRIDNSISYTGSSTYELNEQCLFNLTDKIENATSLTLQYDPIGISKAEYFSSWGCGKPYEKFSLPVTVIEHE